MTLSSGLRASVLRGALRPDAAQTVAARALDQALLRSQRPRWLGRLALGQLRLLPVHGIFSDSPRPRPRVLSLSLSVRSSAGWLGDGPRGVYLSGSVGCGKTMLMAARAASRESALRTQSNVRCGERERCCALCVFPAKNCVKHSAGRDVQRGASAWRARDAHALARVDARRASSPARAPRRRGLYDDGRQAACDRRRHGARDGPPGLRRGTSLSVGVGI